jgi:hypothetical protein
MTKGGGTGRLEDWSSALRTKIMRMLGLSGDLKIALRALLLSPWICLSSSTCCPVIAPALLGLCDTGNNEGVSMIGSDLGICARLAQGWSGRGEWLVVESAVVSIYRIPVAPFMVSSLDTRTERASGAIVPARV